MNDDYLIDEVEEEGNPDIAPSFQALKADKFSAGSIRSGSRRVFFNFLSAIE